MFPAGKVRHLLSRVRYRPFLCFRRMISCGQECFCFCRFHRRSVSTELEVRNRSMYRLYASGKSLQDLADQFGVSRQRVAQIIARFAEAGVSDDESRSLMRTQLEYLQSEMIAIVNRGP